MTERELQKLIEGRLKKSGLLESLLRKGQQIFQVPEGFFVEIVLNNGSKLGAAERLVAEIADELNVQGIRLISIVRARWSIVPGSVRRVGTIYGPSGGIRAGILGFEASLQSGDRTTRVAVEVTSEAVDRLKEQLKKDDLIWEKIAQFLDHALSIGGAGHWDPIRHPQLRMNDAAVLYILSHQPLTAA